MIVHTIEEIREKLKYFDDKDFVFDEPTHKYTYKGQPLFGTTTFLERFYEKFDSDYWSKKKAADAGVTQEEMLAVWDAKRDRSCELGHNVHYYIEKFYLTQSTDKPLQDEEACLRIDKFHTVYDLRLNKLEPIGTEIRVFSKKWKLAGTMDMLYLYKNTIIVGDWKTNEKIKTDKDFNFNKMMYYPFENLKENELNKYSIQISFYMLMLEEAGIFPEYGFICHIPQNGDAQIYKLKDLRAELRTYMNNLQLEDTDNQVVTEKKVKTEDKKDEKKGGNTRQLW